MKCASRVQKKMSNDAVIYVAFWHKYAQGNINSISFEFGKCQAKTQASLNITKKLHDLRF